MAGLTTKAITKYCVNHVIMLRLKVKKKKVMLRFQLLNHHLIIEYVKYLIQI